jgi:hypothetical protein
VLSGSQYLSFLIRDRERNKLPTSVRDILLHDPEYFQLKQDKQVPVFISTLITSLLSPLSLPLFSDSGTGDLIYFFYFLCSESKISE